MAMLVVMPEGEVIVSFGRDMSSWVVEDRGYPWNLVTIGVSGAEVYGYVVRSALPCLRDA